MRHIVLHRLIFDDADDADRDEEEQLVNVVMWEVLFERLKSVPLLVISP